MLKIAQKYFESLSRRDFLIYNGRNKYIRRL